MIFDRFFSSSQQRYGPMDDYWYQDAGQQTESGARVTEETAMRISAVFGCVRILAETLSSLPLQVYRRLDNGDREIARNHPLYQVLHSAPNAWQTSMEWREMMQGHLSLRGNSYSRIVPGPRGLVDQLIPLHPDRVRTEVMESGEPRYVHKPKSGEEQIYLQHEMLHLRGLSSNGYVGINPIEQQREAIGMSMAATSYGARFFKNDARPRGVLKMPGTFKDQPQLDRFKSEWKATQGGRNQHNTAVLEGGMEYQAIGLSNEDAQYLETRRFQLEEIARIFRIPLHMLQDLTRGTFSNIEHQSISFVMHTMVPWIVRWEQRLDRSLITAPGQYFVAFTVEGLLRGDVKSRYEAYQSAINTGWMTRNEARQKENLNALPGLDAPLQPLNMTDGNNARAEKLYGAAARSLVRKETAAIRRFTSLLLSGEFVGCLADFYADHAGHMERKLSLHPALVHVYCERSINQLAAVKLPKEFDEIFLKWEEEKPDSLLKLIGATDGQV